MQTIARQNDLLRHGSAIEERLTRLALEGGTLADIANAAAELTGKPCTIHDAVLPPARGRTPRGSDCPAPDGARRAAPRPPGDRARHSPQ